MFTPEQMGAKARASSSENPPTVDNFDQWGELSRWGKETNELSPWDRKFAFAMGRGAANGWTMSEKQRKCAGRILIKSLAAGFAIAEVGHGRPIQAPTPTQNCGLPGAAEGSE
jgi:hypothetical protein